MIRKGSAKWMGTVDQEDLREGTALLRITVDNPSGSTTSHYWVYSRSPRLVRLMKMGGKSKVYQVTDGVCDCPDSKNGHKCKHSRALETMLPKVS